MGAVKGGKAKLRQQVQKGTNNYDAIRWAKNLASSQVSMKYK